MASIHMNIIAQLEFEYDQNTQSGDVEHRSQSAELSLETCALRDLGS